MINNFLNTNYKTSESPKVKKKTKGIIKSNSKKV